MFKKFNKKLKFAANGFQAKSRTHGPGRFPPKNWSTGPLHEKDLLKSFLFKYTTYNYAHKYEDQAAKLENLAMKKTTYKMYILKSTNTDGSLYSAEVNGKVLVKRRDSTDKPIVLIKEDLVLTVHVTFGSGSLKNIIKGWANKRP